MQVAFKPLSPSAGASAPVAGAPAALSPEHPRKVPDMARRIVAAVVRALQERPAEDPVHFHAGTAGRPYVCHDPHCVSPHLDVTRG